MELPDGLAAWHLWLGAAVVLAVLELLSLDLVLLMIAAGALVGMGLDLVGLPLWVQAVGALGTSVASLSVVRPNMVKRLHGSTPDLVIGHQTLVGKEGVVVESVSGQGGLVRVAGELWTARPYDERTVIEPGRTVEIYEAKGATVYVNEVPELT